MTKEQQIRAALKKDFESLYVKEYTTTWELDRLVRGLDIDIMSLKNTMKVVSK